MALLDNLVTGRTGALDTVQRRFIEFSRNELFLVLAIDWVVFSRAFALAASAH